MTEKHETKNHPLFSNSKCMQGAHWPVAFAIGPTPGLQQRADFVLSPARYNMPRVIEP